MTISSTSSTSSDTSILQLLESLLNNDNKATSTGSSASASDSTNVSNPGKLFSELEKLSKSDPAEFKKVTAEIADQLKTAAGNTTDANQASFLTQLANSFQTASQSGNFSDLFPHKTQTSSDSQPYAPPANNDAVNSVFSAALAQIQTALNSSGNS